MKKKLFLLLLIVALAAFVFTGCTPSAEGEGEGEGEGEVTEPTIEIDGGYVKGQYTFVKGGGTYDVTVSFPTPQSNVELSVVYDDDCLVARAVDVDKIGGLLEPVEGTNKTVWKGSYTFNQDKTNGSDCVCKVGYLKAAWGECEPDCYAKIPVIIDSDKPYAKITVTTTDDCCCERCNLVFKSTAGKENLCDSCVPEACCDDDCSGLASWQIDLYTVKNADSWGDDYALFFDDCCGISPCAELVDTCSGTECPIKCETKCLEPGIIVKQRYSQRYSVEDGIYFAVITLEDNVGNKQTYYAQIELVYNARTNPVTIGATTYGVGCNVRYLEICCGEKVCSTPTVIGDCSDTDTCKLSS